MFIKYIYIYNFPAQKNKPAGQQAVMMIMIVSQHFSIITQLSFNLTPKQQLSKLPKRDKKYLFPGLCLIVVNNSKTIFIPKNSLNPAYPIVVAQAKLQLKDQMQVVLTFKLTTLYRPRCVCFTGGITRSISTYRCLT